MTPPIEGTLVDWNCRHDWQFDDTCSICGEERPLDDKSLREHIRKINEIKRSITKGLNWVRDKKEYPSGEYLKKNYSKLKQASHLLFRLYKNMEPQEVGEVDGKKRFMRYDEVGKPRRIV